MVDFRITRMYKLLEVNNDMAHYYYYIAYGKIYNEEGTRFRRFKFVECFDIFDVMEYFDKDVITEKEIKWYASDLIGNNSYLLNIDNFNDIKHLKEFFDWCRETIRKYNKVVAING